MIQSAVGVFQGTLPPEAPPPPPPAGEPAGIVVGSNGTGNVGSATVNLQTVSPGGNIIISEYTGDLPFPANGLPLLGPPVSFEFLPPGATGSVTICFAVPPGETGVVSRWDTSVVPNVETGLPTFSNDAGDACATVTESGVFGLVQQ